MAENFTKQSRRDFLRNILVGSCALSMDPLLRFIPSEGGHADAFHLKRVKGLSHVEAMYYEKLADKEVICKICPRECRVGDIELGYCGLRKNEGGVYYFLTDNRICSYHVDPIEKKPLFHFLPGTSAYSIATAGCNMHCKFCQNYQISQVRPDQIQNIKMTPSDCVQQVRLYNARSIAYTYTEPVAFYDYMYRISKVAKGSGVRNVMISAGYINPDPLKDICKYIDAIKIDLKAFTESFYKKWCQAELEPVLDAMKVIISEGVWLEIVCLVIPSLNDSNAEIRKMSAWIIDNLGDSVPLHFSRFHPTYLLKNLPPTPLSTLNRCRDTALEAGLKYVYVGNVPGHDGENTYCPKCKKILIKRTGYLTKVINLKDGKCAACSETIPGVWS